ncbi:MAG: hypothetical protein NTU44_03535 [Bacteroidetes bacterium]|nr:hypothetical protein [Bacteroidota bacterium]
MKNCLRLLLFDTYGRIATAALLLCILSGIFLAIPYDISLPYLSVTLMVTANPYASLIRNMHYWSAQLFLVFTLIHLVDHLKQSTEDNIKSRYTWLGVTLSLLVTAYAMISGFILKADPDSLQARRILAGLLESLPVGGRILQQTFMGNEKNFQPVYIHHLSTATLLLVIVIYDHARTIWGSLKTLLITLFMIGLLSFFFRAPLSTMDENILKGPWYFVGFQEMLHFFSHPVYLLVFSFLVLAVIFLLPLFRPSIRKVVKYLLFCFLFVYLILTLVAFFFRGENWKWQWPWEHSYHLKTALRWKPLTFHTPVKPVFVVLGRAEGCVACHGGMKGLTESHNVHQTGCFSCHRGDPFTLDKTQAHRHMEMVPGNLSNARMTCGSPGCHPGICDRIPGSLMATLTGMISVDRFAFGENKTPDGVAGLANLGNTAADRHLQHLCVGCHSGNEKTKPGPTAWLDRGGGCNACHLGYEKQARAEFEQQRGKQGVLPLYHPSISLNITNDRCMSCHSRSGRIATSYEGWHETLLKPNEVKNLKGFKILPDGRVFSYTGSDIHYQKGMGCIDCHGSYELMGDGNAYRHKEQAVMVQCIDCHRKDTGNTVKLREADRETQLIYGLRGWKEDERKMAVTEKGNRPLSNTCLAGDSAWMMVGKTTGKTMKMKPPAAACTKGKAHSRLSCEACHTEWVPQCIGCHNAYEKETLGDNMLTGRPEQGSWVEYKDKFLADKPVLGIREKKIVTMTPGMIMSIDIGSFTGKPETINRRLYAPASGHTTLAKGRSCKSCHNDPLAIGYGRGILTYQVTGKTGRWKFEPRFTAKKADSLPEDAWIPFLKERKDISSTRLNIRPFSIEEQHRILTVGACLTCHKENAALMIQSQDDFQKTLQKRIANCVLPVW